MNDRNSIINEINNAMGDGGSWELAEKVYEELRADDRIYYASDREGLKIRDGVDLISVAAKILDREADPNIFRACYYVAPDGQSDIPMTDQDMAHLPDDELIEEAVKAAYAADLIGYEDPKITEEELREGLHIGYYRI